MMKRCLQTLLTLATLAVLFFAAPPAEAQTSIYATGYFCGVELHPNSYYGDAGAISVLLTNQPACQGGIATNGLIFSKNAGTPYLNPSYAYSEAQLMTLLGALQRAVAIGQKGTVKLQPNRGSNNTILSVSFKGD